MDTTNDIKRVIINNQLNMSDELEILYLIVNKYNPMTVSQLARKKKVSQPYISKLFATGKLMHIELSGCKFILGE